MAKAKKELTKTLLERVYTIPLRRETLKVPYYRKAKRAIRTLREFISRHMKSNNIVVGNYLNLKVWEHGIKNPPNKIKVNATKDNEGKVFVELVNIPIEKTKEELIQEKVEKSKKLEKEIKVLEQSEEPDTKIEQIKEKKAEDSEKIEQEEIKELKKEHPKKHTPKVLSKPKGQKLRKKEMIIPKSP